MCHMPTLYFCHASVSFAHNLIWSGTRRKAMLEHLCKGLDSPRPSTCAVPTSLEDHTASGLNRKSREFKQLMAIKLLLDSGCFCSYAVTLLLDSTIDTMTNLMAKPFEATLPQPHREVRTSSVLFVTLGIY